MGVNLTVEGNRVVSNSSLVPGTDVMIIMNAQSNPKSTPIIKNKNPSRMIYTNRK